MAVLKHLRSLSEMEFYRTAIEIRKNITIWLLKDFNTKRNVKSVNQVVKDITEEDKAAVDAIFAKYDVKPNKEFQSEFPTWFVDMERKNLCEILTDLIQHITKANSIFPIGEIEINLRREFQDRAIADCYNIYQELQYIIAVFKIDINKLIPIIESVEKELALLKSWRKSNKKKKKDIA